MDAGFVLALPFHHGYLEPDCVERRGGAYARDKNTSARLCAKNAGGAYARGGAYLRDTTVISELCMRQSARCAGNHAVCSLLSSATKSERRCI